MGGAAGSRASVLALLGQAGDAETYQAREKAPAELQEWARKADEAGADAPRIEAELDAMSRRLNAPCEIDWEDGRKGVLGGAIGDQPFYCSSQNSWQ